jgi:dTDP-4-dehydrorhamnose reductase
MRLRGRSTRLGGGSDDPRGHGAAAAEMKCLVLGATGMLGSAIVVRGQQRGYEVIAGGRSGPAVTLDVRDREALSAALARERPDVLINSVALVDLAKCEASLDLAYAVNARAVALMAQECAEHGARLVHISTDHYFTGDGAAKHDELARVRLVNEYARTKFAGEAFALTRPDALVLRTNVTGFRGRRGVPTFIEWALGAIEGEEQMTLFDDFYTSTMASTDFADAMFDLLGIGANGLVNLASSEVASKREFLLALAEQMGRKLKEPVSGSVRGLTPRRAESLGLDVACAERLLGRDLPDLAASITALLADRPRASRGHGS